MERFKNVFANSCKGTEVLVPKFFPITNKEAGALFEDKRPVIKIYGDEVGKNYDRFEDESVQWLLMASVQGSESNNSVLAVSLQACTSLPHNSFEDTIIQTWSKGELAKMLDLIDESALQIPKGPSDSREASIDNDRRIIDGTTTDQTSNDSDVTITHSYKQSVNEVGRYNNQTQHSHNNTNHKHQRGTNCRNIVPFNVRHVEFLPDENSQHDKPIYNSDRPAGPRFDRTQNDQPKRQMFGSRAHQPNDHHHYYSRHQQQGLTANRQRYNSEIIPYSNNERNNPFEFNNNQFGNQVGKMQKFWDKIVDDILSGSLTEEVGLAASGVGQYLRRTETVSELRIEGNRMSKNKQKSNHMYWIVICLAGKANDDVMNQNDDLMIDILNPNLSDKCKRDRYGKN